MATTTSFQNMLNQFLPNDLLKEEFVKRDWLLSNVEMDNGWLGGTAGLVVPFKGSSASSVSFGSLTASNDIAEDAYVRGLITVQPEAWGTMIFHQKDLWQHGKLSEQNFLKILPDTVDDFLDYMKQVVSLNMLNGTSFATLTADGDASGHITVDRPERFVLNQKIILNDDGTVGSGTYYVINIIIDTAVITVSATRGGSAANVSTYTVAHATKVYFDGSAANGFTSLRQSLLSAANGGSSTLYGQTKTAYPYLQSINISGASINATNILQSIFDAYTTIKNRGKGQPNKIVMSYRNLGYIMSILESQKGSYHIDQTGTKVNAYGWTEIVVTGVKGAVTVVGVQEMNDDCIFFLDTRPSVMKIYSNGGFMKRKSPNGIEYFEVRNTSGYDYILDVAFMADFVLQRPSYCGVLYSIP